MTSLEQVQIDDPLLASPIQRCSQSMRGCRTRSACHSKIVAIQDHQTELCWRFAKDPVDGAANRFDGLEWQQSLNGMPILSGILASIDCTVESVTPAGDHRFVLAQVTSLNTTDVTNNAMIFYKGKVGGVAIHGI